MMKNAKYASPEDMPIISGGGWGNVQHVAVQDSQEMGISVSDVVTTIVNIGRTFVPISNIRYNCTSGKSTEIF